MISKKKLSQLVAEFRSQQAGEQLQSAIYSIDKLGLVQGF
jgi:hypothetical protein